MSTNGDIYTDANGVVHYPGDNINIPPTTTTTNMMGKTYNADYPTAGIDTSVTINTSSISNKIDEIFRKYGFQSDYIPELKQSILSLLQESNQKSRLDELQRVSLSMILLTNFTEKGFRQVAESIADRIKEIINE